MPALQQHLCWSQKPVMAVQGPEALTLSCPSSSPSISSGLYSSSAMAICGSRASLCKFVYAPEDGLQEQ